MISGYKIVQEIYRGRKRVVYRGERNEDGAPVIIKTLIADFPDGKDVTTLKREYEMVHDLQINGVAKAYGLEKYDSHIALILEDIGGEPLRTLIDSKKIDLATFLKIGISISTTIAEIHKSNIIHKDINPKNIIVNTKTGRVQVIDFSISSRLPLESQKISHPHLLEGTLAYISPEQTGRMNRAIDYRTDFYSLGVTFYEILTGRLPFYSTDPMELVHFHIAKIPAPSRELNPDIPQAVSDIVMKLLAKTAEDRYQSAYGLKFDLEICLAKWQTDGKIKDFSLGEKDFSDRFQIPQKLYGREEEIATLMTAFDRVSDGATEMMLVSGYSGIGKSALVNEVHKPIVRERGYFVSGKFDQFKRNIPYSAVIQAFQELVRLALTEGEEEVSAWRDKLTNALGMNGQVIIEVIPEVALIIGEQPPVPELPPAESQNRFNLVFQRFIGVFTQKEHPLVIFLDDLQWADSATLKLLQVLMNDPDIRHMLLIGAYRDNEVSAVHPLIRTLSEIEKSGARLSSIILKPLGLAHLNQFIADTLRSETARSNPLSELVLSKTDGNPFFVTQFLKSLHQERLIHLDYDSGEWQFDLERIRGTGITDNVITLMTGKIQKLSECAQQVSKLAACIGNQFDLNTLSVVNEKPPNQTAAELWEPIQEGLILPISDLALRIADRSADSNIPDPKLAVHKFLHDRVQQAAYSLIPEQNRPGLHLRIGRLLLAMMSEDELEENKFEVVDHLNIGRSLITDPNEKLLLAKLNLSAARKAKLSSAYEPTLKYINAGMEYLPPNSWKENYDLTFSYYLEKGEQEYLIAKWDQAIATFDEALAHAHSLLDRCKVNQYKVTLYRAKNELRISLDIALEALEELGLKLVEPDEAELEEELERFHRLTDREDEALLNLPELENPNELAAMVLLREAMNGAFFVGSRLLFTISMKMVEITVSYGNSPHSAVAYMYQAAFTLSGLVFDFKNAHRFGRLALRLNEERYHEGPYEAIILNNWGGFISHHTEDVDTARDYLRRGYYIALENGMYQWTGYCAINRMYMTYWGPYTLGEASVKIDKTLPWLKRFDQNMAEYFSAMKASISNLEEMVEDWSVLSESVWPNSKEVVKKFHEKEDLIGLLVDTTCRLSLANWYSDYQEAVRYADAGEKYVVAGPGLYIVPVFHFHKCLAYSSAYDHVDRQAQSDYREKIQSTVLKFAIWAEHSPSTYLHRFFLIKAEMARIMENAQEAMDFYDKAIKSARENRFFQNEALANELCAKFWLDRKKENISKLYMTEAYYAYSRWGATAKVKELEKKYPFLLSPTLLEPKERVADSQIALSTIGGRSEALDLMTVIKASQAISGEIVLEDLLEKLMKITIQNAGAERGILILEKEGEMFIQAEGSVKRDEVVVLSSIPLKAQSLSSLPQTILNYAKRTSESVVLGDAQNDSQFGNDPYISQNKPKSILCLPILSQRRLIAILYLENNVTTHAFTPGRIRVMQILSSQAAISLVNARLYNDLKSAADELRFLNDLVEQTDQPVVVSDFDGHLVRFNSAYEKLTGYGSDELRHMTYQQLTPKYWQEFEAEKISKLLLEGKPVRYEKEYRRKDGAPVPLELVVDVYRNANGEPVYLYAFVTDITERKLAEETLRKALLEVEQLKNRLQVENIYLQEEIKTEYNFEEIIGQSEPLKKALRRVEQVAPTDATVLIYGETGTGKELIARAIHNLSPRKDRPLVKVNCGAISAGLVESELFGHEKGAFTGALQRRIGRFELADGGTIFLDEVTELPLDTQVKLLRVLQERELERVGSSKSIEVDVRVIAATNRDIGEAVKAAKFRSDLFYRLNVFPLEVPPLRERKYDIPLLANFFLTKFSKKLGKKFQGISRATMTRLTGYLWPGNIRELQNVIERAVVTSHSAVIQIDESILGSNLDSETISGETLEEVERAYILRVLEDKDWVIQGKGGAASVLGINPNTLRSRMQKLGIRKPGRSP